MKNENIKTEIEINLITDEKQSNDERSRSGSYSS